MTKRYRVTHVPHYIGQRLVQPDRGDESIVTLPDGVSPGKHLVEVDGGAVAAAAAPVDLVGPFKIKHNGGGNFVVLDSKGAQAGDVYKKDADDAAKAKTDAQDEADRLNGQSTPAAQDDQLTAADHALDNLPDA